LTEIAVFISISVDDSLVRDTERTTSQNNVFSALASFGLFLFQRDGLDVLIGSNDQF
jgi:hypothetical protein